MKRLTIIILIGICAVGPSQAGAGSDTKVHEKYLISLPQVKLSKEPLERIDAVRLKMQCGRFLGIHTIPNDWSAQVVSPQSEKTTLTMEAGHGSTSLGDLEDFTDFATIIKVSNECFDISGTIHVFSYDGQAHERTIDIRQGEMTLRELPNKRVQRTGAAGR